MDEKVEFRVDIVWPDGDCGIPSFHATLDDAMARVSILRGMGHGEPCARSKVQVIRTSKQVVWSSDAPIPAEEVDA